MTIDTRVSSVLITGGSDGIGRALAERFLATGSNVLVTGRDPAKLKKAASELPGLSTLRNDLRIPAERQRLAEHVAEVFPNLNVVINNAGIQRRISLAEDKGSWDEKQAEIDLLLSAPIHLNSLLIALMLRSGKNGTVVNVTSGGAFIPQPFAPVYSACKAALHSYTMTLRHALNTTPIRVVELAPPAVRTALAGPNASHGAPLGEFADKVFAELTEGQLDFIGYGPTDSEQFRRLLHSTDSLFAASADRFPVTLYRS